MPPVKKTGITSWLDRQLEEAEERVGGGIEKFYKGQQKAEAKENAFDSPTLRAYGQMIGAGVKNKQGVVIGSGLRENSGQWEAMIGGRWRKVPDPKTYFQQKSREKWREGAMPEDKKKSPGAAKSGAAGEKNAKGGPKYAEDDHPIQGMNPTSGPLGGGPVEAPPSPPPGGEAPGMPPGGGDPLSGAKWAEPILKAIPGNRGDLMNKAMKLIGQLGEILTEAGYVEGGGGGVVPGPEASPPPSPGGEKSSPPPPPTSPGMMQ